MGTEVPEESPEYEDDKFYLCSVDAYQDVGPATDCSQTFVMRQRCCQQGNILNAWIQADVECQAGWELCVVSGWTAQRLVAVHGPYDDRDACMLDM